MWPAEILGKIDLDKAAKGEKLYRGLCLHCHEPPMFSDEGRKPERWTTFTNSDGRQFFKVTMIPLAEIGTDPKEVLNNDRATTESGPLGKGTIPATEGLKYLTQKVIDQAYAELKLSPEQQKEWNGTDKTNFWRLKYRARPRNGIWATPPYLHNEHLKTL